MANVIRITSACVSKVEHAIDGDTGIHSMTSEKGNCPGLDWPSPKPRPFYTDYLRSIIGGHGRHPFNQFTTTLAPTHNRFSSMFVLTYLL